jgi:hypothetical protein
MWRRDEIQVREQDTDGSDTVIDVVPLEPVGYTNPITTTFMSRMGGR